MGYWNDYAPEMERSLSKKKLAKRQRILRDGGTKRAKGGSPSHLNRMPVLRGINLRPTTGSA